MDAAPEGGDVVLVTIVTDNYGNETYWRIMDEGGNKISEGGNPNVENNYGTGIFPPPVGSGTYGNGQTYNQEVVIPEIGRASCRERGRESCRYNTAEDGIRAFHVTGVQTCALPIYKCNRQLR